MSSHNVPSLQDLQADPLSALTKGWGLFSSAVAAAGSTINESVIQPGMKQAGQTVGELNERGLGGLGEQYGAQGKDLTGKFAEQAKVTTGWLSSVAGEGWARANQLAKERAGVDLDFTDRLGHLRSDGPSKYQGYGQVGSGGQQGNHHDDNDGWGDWDDGKAAALGGGFRDDVSEPRRSFEQPRGGKATSNNNNKPKDDENWDEDWKAF
jgi:ADP-ribosylation factor GTPase-activating protein 1